MKTFLQLEKDTTWEYWRNRAITRRDTLTGDDIVIEPGAAYFVQALERLDADVLFSCEGHPKGFYVCFAASHDIALRITNCGYMTVELCRDGRWTISLRNNEAGVEGGGKEFTYQRRDQLLKCAAASWECALFGAQ